MTAGPGQAPKEDLGVLPIRRLAIGATGVGKSGRNYRLVTPIAKGGMGELYLSVARRTGHTDQLCVIKRLLEEHKTDTDYVEMFRFEAEMMTHLDHPNIVKILDVPVIEETQCLALEYVKGRSVGQVIDHSNEFGHPLLPAQAVLRILIGVLEGLDHVHNAKLADGTSLGLVHRDVTPGNLLLSFDGDVKITDFGIAKGQMSAVSTTVGIVKGKARYLSPEQILGEKATPRSDLFACACVAYEMLTGFPLFEQSSVPKTLYAIVNGERPDLASALPRDALPIVPALERALATDVSKRPQSALEFADDLREAGLGMPGPMSAADLGKYLRELFKDAPEPWESLDQLTKLISAAEGIATAVASPPHPPAMPPPPPPPDDSELGPKGVQQGSGSTARIRGSGQSSEADPRIRAETFNEFEALEQDTHGELFVPERSTAEELSVKRGSLEAPKIHGPIKPDLAKIAASISAEKAREAKLASASGERELKALASASGERGRGAIVHDPASLRPEADVAGARSGMPDADLEDAVTQHATPMLPANPQVRRADPPSTSDARPIRANELSAIRTQIDASKQLKDEAPQKARPEERPSPPTLRFDDEESVTESKRHGASLPVFALGLVVGVGATLLGLRLLTKVERPAAIPVVVAQATDASVVEESDGGSRDAEAIDAGFADFGDAAVTEARVDARSSDARTGDARPSDADSDELEAAPSPAAPVADERNGRLDVLFPVGARVKVDGKLLDDKIPIRGLVIGPGNHQVQIIAKSKHIRPKLTVTITAGQRLVLDKKQIQIK
ncbi:MAG: serine/threonine protein kinase [Deltaproteobacteria bacterium]|nr:serine/threonine protein kinase [Deltaproteobacteria bacterium]